MMTIKRVSSIANRVCGSAPAILLTPPRSVTHRRFCSFVEALKYDVDPEWTLRRLAGDFVSP
eukprot:15482364-Alexandrium_andersonii.AAC.2